MTKAEEKQAYENLANAIIIQAIKDYKVAYRAWSIDPFSLEKKARVDRLRHFFKSEYCSILTKLDMPRVIKVIEKQIDEIRRCTL